MRSILLLVLLLSLRVVPAFGELRGSVVSVSDGDTVRVLLRGREERIRLIGIDAPELNENPKALRDAERSKRDLASIYRAGSRSRDFLRDLAAPGTEVVVEHDVQRTDPYGRRLAYLWLPDGRLINEMVVREGYAGLMTYPPNIRYVDRLRDALAVARREQRGLWSGDGALVPHRDERRKR